jgi:adenylate kinase
MRIVLLGAPGAGKGTQCKKIVDRYGVQHLSSGDILRQERAKGTELGKKAQSFMDSGTLVPDNVVVDMMADAIKKVSKKGFVLDGFPRTVNQAKELDKSLVAAGQKIDAVLNLMVDDKIIVRRIAGRRSCSKCGAVYHIENMKPKKDGVCDKCGGPLVQRPDDTEAVVANRLKNYYQQTAPVIDYYKLNNTVFDFDSNRDSDEVANLMFEKLDVFDGKKGTRL